MADLPVVDGRQRADQQVGAGGVEGAGWQLLLGDDEVVGGGAVVVAAEVLVQPREAGGGVVGEDDQLPDVEDHELLGVEPPDPVAVGREAADEGLAGGEQPEAEVVGGPPRRDRGPPGVEEPRADPRADGEALLERWEVGDPQVGAEVEVLGAEGDVAGWVPRDRAGARPRPGGRGVPVVQPHHLAAGGPAPARHHRDVVAGVGDHRVGVGLEAEARDR